MVFALETYGPASDGVSAARIEEGATLFLVDVLGCEYTYSLGPFRSDDEWMRDHLNVDPRPVMEKLSFFRMGGTNMLEVFQYRAPDQRKIQPKIVTSEETTSLFTWRP